MNTKMMTTSDNLPADIELLSVKQLAKLFDCSERHIFRLVEASKLPRPVKLSNLCRWPRRTILAWIEGGCQPCEPVQTVG